MPTTVTSRQRQHEQRMPVAHHGGPPLPAWPVHRDLQAGRAWSEAAVAAVPAGTATAATGAKKRPLMCPTSCPARLRTNVTSPTPWLDSWHELPDAASA